MDVQTKIEECRKSCPRKQSIKFILHLNGYIRPHNAKWADSVPPSTQFLDLLTKADHMWLNNGTQICYRSAFILMCVRSLFKAKHTEKSTSEKPSEIAHMRHINATNDNNNDASTHHPKWMPTKQNELMPNEEWFIILYVERVSAYIIKLRFTSRAEDCCVCVCVCTFCAAAKIECLSDQCQTCMHLYQ